MDADGVEPSVLSDAPHLDEAHVGGESGYELAFAPAGIFLFSGLATEATSCLFLPSLEGSAHPRDEVGGAGLALLFARASFVFGLGGFLAPLDPGCVAEALEDAGELGECAPGYPARLSLRFTSVVRSRALSITSCFNNILWSMLTSIVPRRTGWMTWTIFFCPILHSLSSH